MNTSRSGARITSRWWSAWSVRSVALADPKESVILEPLSIKNSSRNFGKLARISTSVMVRVVARLHTDRGNGYGERQTIGAARASQIAGSLGGCALARKRHSHRSES